MSLFISGFLLTFLVWLFVVTVRDKAWRKQNYDTWCLFMSSVVAFLAAALFFAFWFHDARDIRDPAEVGRLVVGMLLAVVLVLWLLRRQGGYNDNEAAVQALRPLPQRLDATLDAKWAFLLIAILLLVVLFLPHFDRVIDNMQEFKAGSIEIKLSVEQASGSRQQLQHALEQGYINYFRTLNNEQVLLERLQSDVRAVKLLGLSPEKERLAIAALNSFEPFYRNVVLPVVKCVNSALEAGADAGALKLEIGSIAHDMSAMLTAKDVDRLQRAADDAQTNVTKLTSRRDCAAPTIRKGKSVPLPKKNPFSLSIESRDSLARSGWTHFVIGAFFGFADNPIQATRYLAGVGAGNHNVQSLLVLAAFWDGLGRPERSIGYLDDARETSERHLRKACDRAGIASDPKSTALHTRDVERWERAVAQTSNDLAYRIARNSEINRRELQAFELSRYAISWYRGDFRSCSTIKQSAESRQKYSLELGGAIDTFAYLVLASELAAPRPSQHRIACTFRVFEHLRNQWLQTMADVATNKLTTPTGRIEFEATRLVLNVVEGHVQLAARALRGREPRCSLEDRERMEKGQLGRG